MTYRPENQKKTAITVVFLFLFIYKSVNQYFKKEQLHALTATTTFSFCLTNLFFQRFLQVRLENW